MILTLSRTPGYRHITPKMSNLFVAIGFPEFLAHFIILSMNLSRQRDKHVEGSLHVNET